MPNGRPANAHLRGRTAIYLAATALFLTAVAPPGRTAGSTPLADLSFEVGGATLFEASSPGGGMGRTKGEWFFERGRMQGGELRLHFEIEPPPPTLPVRSGPAVLFGGLHLYGDAGGDVGLELRVPTVVHEAIPGCLDDVDCRYTVDIDIPTQQLPSAIRRLERQGKLVSVSATLTLVRTFGDGQWLEVLAFIADGHRSGAGYLGAMKPAEGALLWSGLVPASRVKPIRKDEHLFPDGLDYPAIVERVRQEVGDSSTALTMVDVDLRVAVEPACSSYSEMWLHGNGGEHLFHTLAYDKSIIEDRTIMPVGIPWYLTLSGGGGVAEPAALLGPIISDESPIGVFATFDCDAWTGTLRLVGAAAATTAPTAVPPATVTPASTAAPGTAALSVGPSPSTTSAPSAATGVPMLLAIAAGVVVAVGAVALAAGRGWFWRRPR